VRKNKILDEINNPASIKKLSFEELNELAQEIRTLIIQTVSETGGHLASNLGAVELTLALHKVFNFPEDKLIFDVSHQIYTHKIITNRKDRFYTLRQYGGISGYANPTESKFDTFIAGHASTSLALALGFVEARKIKKKNYEVIAIIGDGAFTAGEAYEGLNNLGRLKEKTIIVLNDNEMSISRNVGAMPRYLSRLRSSTFYQRLKSHLPRTTIGRRIKLAIKDLILPVAFFEELGFTYLGPIDGHNIRELTNIFERTKNINYPIIVHVITRKGKGYEFAEKDPTKFHGTHPFYIETGRAKKISAKKSFSEVFGNTLALLGEKNDKIFTITAAMPDGTKTNKFRDRFPDRFIDVGIAEQCAVSAGAGMAKEGLKPIVAIYSTFMQRAYDQVIHDVGILNLPVVLALDRAGVVSQDGPTHQGVFDLSFMRIVPNFIVMAPKDAAELKAMLEVALEYKHPVSIRYPKDYADESEDIKIPIECGKAELIKSGGDLLIISIGVMYYPAMEAIEILKNKGISAGLINARFVKPIDRDLILNEALKTGKVITVEDNTIIGGFGSAVKEILSDSGVTVFSIGINDVFPEQGDRDELLKKYGLSGKNIASIGEKLVKKKN